MNKDLQTAVRHRLIDLDMTQLELSEKVGVSPAVINYMLTGRRQGKYATWARVLNEVGLQLSAQTSKD